MRLIGPIGLILAFCLASPVAKPQDEPAVGPAKAGHFDYRRAAVAAYQAKDYHAMLAACEAALALRPDSARYLFNLASAQVLTSQPDAALATLNRLADLGLSLPIERNPDLASLHARPEFTAIVARLAANIAPRGTVTTLHELPAVPGILEGLAWREKTGDLFLSDVHARCIWRLAPDGTLTIFAQPPELLGAFGLAVDERRDALWVATAALPEMTGYTDALKGRAALVELSLTTGELRRVIPVPADDRDHVLGDLTLAPDGTIYLTDSAAPIIWQLAPGAAQLTQFVESPVFASLQGLTLVNAARTLVVSDYANGLHAIDLATRALRSLAPPPRVTLLGLDGLLAHDGALLAVQNGLAPQRLVRITLTPTADAIADFTVLATTLPHLDDLTLLTLVAGRPTVIAGSGWSAFEASKTPPPHAARLLQFSASPVARPQDEPSIGSAKEGLTSTAALALYKSKNYPEARVAYQQLLEIDPANAQYRYFLGAIALKRNDHEDAINQLEKATALAPTNSDYFAELGDAYGRAAAKGSVFAQMGYAKKCLAALEQAVQLNPDNLGARNGLVSYYRQAPGFLGGGMPKAYAQAEEIKKRDLAMGTLILGQLYIADHRFDEARALFDSLLAAAPDSYIAHYSLGRLAAESGQNLDAGETHLRRCLELTPAKDEPSHAAVHWRLGHLAEKRSDPAAARTAYEAALALDPNFKQAKVSLEKLK